VLGHLGYRAAASVQHLAAPAVVADKTSGATLRELVGNREEVAFGVALGLFERLQVSALVPVVLHQNAELPGQNLGTATASGFGNLTLVPRAVVIDGSAVKLGVEVPVTLPLWETPAYMGYEGWGVEPRLLSEAMAGPLVFSVALGALLKPEQRIFNLEDGDQLTYALAGQYPDAVRGWDFGLEYQGGTPLANPGRSTATRGEVLLGARHRFNEQLSVTAGTGAGVMSGIGQSSYRVFLALGYAGSLLAAEAPARDCSIQPGESAPPAGCPAIDSDSDGIADDADKCHSEAEDIDNFEDADGCPDPDNDADGAPDSDDGCPMEPEDKDGFKDADGCPEPDNDADGVADPSDKCPLSAEDQPGPDADGCPERATCPDGAEPTESGQCLAHLEVGLIHIAEPIQFSADTAKLVDSSRQVLDQVVDILDANPHLKVRIIGHTDGEGPASINQHLSQLRANSVRWYLLDQSKNPNHLARRLVAIGKGESEPVDKNDTAVGRSRNRRVEFLIVDETPKKAPAPPKKPAAGK
jgi:outer membrane protein OmpA-like peptidoglycan-associated protein